ncbi:MAG: RHS repeat protein, partial [bacterium]|nr:RHS repeat protein [bacterium]
MPQTQNSGQALARTYNNDFDLKTLNVAGTSYTFGYDNDRLLTSAGALAIGRDAANGFVKTTQLGGIATAQTYTAFGELQQYQVTQGGITLLFQTYSYDKLGRITQKLEAVQGQTDSYGYGYDTAGRLATVSKNGAVITTYGYDANGNRTGQTDPRGNTTTFDHDAQNRRTMRTLPDDKFEEWT